MPSSVVTADGLVIATRQLCRKSLAILSEIILVHSFLNGRNRTLKSAAQGILTHPLRTLSVLVCRMPPSVPCTVVIVVVLLCLRVVRKRVQALFGNPVLTGS